MAFRGVVLCLVMVLMANMWTQNAAQSGCTTALTSLSPCLNYILGSSSTPSASCCSKLSSVVQSSPQCLCSVLNGGGSSLGITINQTLALSLPSACKVQTPPVSQCKAGNGPISPSTAPVDSPVGSPSDSSTQSPEGSITPSASDFPSAGNGPISPSTAPVDSPIGSPSDSSTQSPEGSITPSASDFPSGAAGSKSVPSTDGGPSDGSTIKVPFHIVLSLLAIMSCFTTKF